MIFCVQSPIIVTMAVIKKTLTQLKHEDAIAEFNKWSAIKELGVQKFSTAYCLAKAGQKTYLALATVEKIVFRSAS